MPLSFKAAASRAAWLTVRNGSASVPGLSSDAEGLWLFTNRICRAFDSSIAAPVAAPGNEEAPTLAARVDSVVHEFTRRQLMSIKISHAHFMRAPVVNLSASVAPLRMPLRTRFRVAA